MTKFLLLAMGLLTSPAMAQTLDGQWTTECEPFGRHAMISTITFESGQLNAHGNLYERPGCAIKTVRSELNARYTTGSNHGQGVEFDLTPLSFTITLLKQDVVEHYNQNKICDFDTWELNIPKDILGQSNCVGFTPPYLGETIYDIFKLNSEDDLKFSFFPTEMTIRDIQNRPTEIPSDATKLWKISNDSFNRVHRDLKILDHHISQQRAEFSRTPIDINDKNWVKFKLDFMVEIDQYVRNYVNTPHQLNYSEAEKRFFQQEIFSRFEDIDRTNTNDLKQLLSVYNWFRISEFGRKADIDAWIIAQHADFDHEFQKNILERLGSLWPIGETHPRNYAYLFDRVAVSFNNPSQRVPQRYGTQGFCIGPGQWQPFEIEDPIHVDVRRSEVGLEPLADYIAGFREICR